MNWWFNITTITPSILVWQSQKWNVFVMLSKTHIKTIHSYGACIATLPFYHFHAIQSSAVIVGNILKLILSEQFCQKPFWMEPNFELSIRIFIWVSSVEEFLKDENDTINEKIFFMQKRKQRLTKKNSSPSPKISWSPRANKFKLQRENILHSFSQTSGIFWTCYDFLNNGNHPR